MSERTTESRDSEVVKNEPLVSDIDEKKEDNKKTNVKLLIIIIAIFIILITIIVILFLLNNDNSNNEDEEDKEDEEEEIEGTDSIIATYIVYNPTDNIKLFNEKILDSINSIEINGETYNNTNTFVFNSSGEFEVIININKGIESMEEMFKECGNLININLTQLNTKKLKTISGMFYDCNYLSSINLNTFNTSSVENMIYLFSNNKYL